MKKAVIYISLFIGLGLMSSCNEGSNANNQQERVKYQLKEGTKMDVYANVELKADISHLSTNEIEVLLLMFQAADIMDDLFWKEAYGNRDTLLNRIDDSRLKLFTKINYGPWDRLNNNKAFIDGFGEKPAGANFYPVDMTKEEFEALDDPDKNSLYTLIRRDENGKLRVVWYHEAFAPEIEKAADLLDRAAEIAEDEGLKKYLRLRAKALRTDDYRESDMAWMDMKNSNIDYVIGPIENYEDHLYGYKAAHESFILIKDVVWSKKLARFAKFLPQLQKDLPVDEKYKKDVPGSDVDLNAYDVIYYTGDCNAGSKTIAINLPNDEVVQKTKGSRKLQLKNAMKAKFDKILVPISEVLIDESQRKHITFDAFFANTMFHEVAHGLGVKNTINGKGTVRTALKEHSSALEEGKADILGLYMIQQLVNKGELKEDFKDNMVTFLAGIFRSVRFGASSAHGKANMIRFNFFKEKGAFTRNEDGTFKVNFDKMEIAMKEMSNLILTLQGNGDYDGVAKLVAEKGIISPELQADLDRLGFAGIPVDVVFEQGTEVLGL